jgi:hypothetical protein
VCGFVSPALAPRTFFIALSSWVGGIFKKKEQDDALSRCRVSGQLIFLAAVFWTKKLILTYFHLKYIYKKLL